MWQEACTGTTSDKAAYHYADSVFRFPVDEEAGKVMNYE